MDTAAIFTYFETLNTEENTVLLLSNHLYQTVSSVWSEIPGVKLVYEPSSVQNKEFLDLLSTLDITIKCSNQDLLDNLSRKESVVIGTSNLTSSFIKSAFAKGFNNFLTEEQSRDVAKITSIIGDGFNLTEKFSKEENPKAIFKDVLKSGSNAREICVGTVQSLQELRALKDRIMDLKWKLDPTGVVLSVELGQELFQSTFLIATKIIGKKILDGQTSYSVDMSMFAEFSSYLDMEKNFTVYSHSDKTSYSSLYGNTEEEDDLILEGEMGQVETGDWILLGNVGLADCRDLDMILLDKDYRVVTPRNPSQAFSNSLDLESSLLTVSA